VYSYKEYNTLSKLAQLTEVKLSAAGVESKDDRKLVMTALRKAGCVSKESPRKKIERIPDEGPVAGPSSPPTMSTVQVVVFFYHNTRSAVVILPSLLDNTDKEEETKSV
jgi:hypothetical protein